MTPPVDIAGLRSLAGRATPGGWGSDGTTVTASEGAIGDYADIGEMRSKADARLVAAAVNALPALCDRVEELEGELARLTAPAITLTDEQAKAILGPERWAESEAKVARALRGEGKTITLEEATAKRHAAKSAYAKRVAELEEQNARLRVEVADLKAELLACRDVNLAARRCVAIGASGDLHRRLAQLALALRRPAKSDGEGGVG